MSDSGTQETQSGLVVVRAWGDMKPSERIRRVVDMYLDKYTHAEIGEAVGMSVTEVGVCISDIKKLWLSQAVMDFNEAKARELARIDRIELEAWDSFKISKRPIVIIGRRKLVPPDPCNEGSDEPEMQAHGPGDPKWLAIITKCVEMRAKIFGFLRDNKVVNNNYMQLDWDSLTRQPGGVETLQDVRDHVEDEIAAQEAEADEYERQRAAEPVVRNGKIVMPKPAGSTPKPKPQTTPLRPVPPPIASHPHLPQRGPRIVPSAPAIGANSPPKPPNPSSPKK